MSNRILSDSLLTSETLDELCPSQENLFYRLLVVVDDYGCTDARPVVVLARCYPLRISKIPVEDMKTWLLDLARVGLITLYQVEGKEYLQVSKWEKHQRVRNKRHKCPLPTVDDSDPQQIAATLDKLVQSAASCGELRRVAASCGNPPSESLSLSISLSKDKDSVEQKMLDAPLPPPKPKRKTKDMSPEIMEVLTYLNAKIGSKYSVASDLVARFKQGATVEQAKAIIDKKVAEWAGTEMAPWLKPSTLFCKKHFDEYLNQPGIQTASFRRPVPVPMLTPEQDAKHKAKARSWFMDEKAKQEAR